MVDRTRRTSRTMSVTVDQSRMCPVEAHTSQRLLIAIQIGGFQTPEHFHRRPFRARLRVKAERLSKGQETLRGFCKKYVYTPSGRHVYSSGSAVMPGVMLCSFVGMGPGSTSLRHSVQPPLRVRTRLGYDTQQPLHLRVYGASRTRITRRPLETQRSLVAQSTGL